MATAFKKVSNNGQTILANDITNSQTNISIPTGHVTRFPSSGQFRVRVFNVVDPEGGEAYQTELMLVTSGAGTTSWTVTRNYDGLGAISAEAGDAVQLFINADDITDLQTAVNALETSVASLGGVDTGYDTRLDALEVSPITNVNGRSVLTGPEYLIIATNGTYADTGLSITLPSPGTYLISLSVRCRINSASGPGYIISKLYNSTLSADIANTEVLAGLITSTGVEIQLTSASVTVVTVSGSTAIKLYVKRDGSSSWTSSSIYSDNNGRTSLSYVKIAP